MSDDPAIFEPPAIKRRPRQNEHLFQAWADRLIDRIVMPPMFVAGIDHASQQTDNQRARMAARGIKFGMPDMFVAQLNVRFQCSLWVELKRGAPVSPTQLAVHDAMRAAGQNVIVCRTMANIVAALREAGFELHPNTDALAAEYEMRVVAAEKAPSKPRSGKPVQRKLTREQFQRAQQILRSVGR